MRTRPASQPRIFIWQRVRESNPVSRFRDVAQFRHKYALCCALEGEMQIRPFARFAQNNPVPVSDFVRTSLRTLTNGLIGLVSQTLFGGVRAQACWACECGNLPAVNAHVSTDDLRAAVRRLRDHDRTARRAFYAGNGFVGGGQLILYGFGNCSHHAGGGSCS